MVAYQLGEYARERGGVI